MKTNRKTFHPIAALAAAAAFAAAAATLAGCAGAPTASSPSTSPEATTATASCAQLDADIAQTDEALRAAQAKSQDAWKVVVPFAVAARYATSKSAANSATQQLDQLRAEAARRGCPGHAG